MILSVIFQFQNDFNFFFVLLCRSYKSRKSLVKHEKQRKIKEKTEKTTLGNGNLS